MCFNLTKTTFNLSYDFDYTMTMLHKPILSLILALLMTLEYDYHSISLAYHQYIN